MNHSQITKRTLTANIVVLLVCISLLIVATYAWFTDSASTSGNRIVAGNLDVDIVDASNESISLAGKNLEWVKASGAEDEAILFEPGATYNLQSFKVKNQGSLALKYRLSISGFENADLTNVLDVTVTGLDDTQDGYTLAELSGENAKEFSLAANQSSSAITISVHMQETAANQYMNTSIERITVTVLAKQDTVESDSKDNQYDSEAEYGTTVNSAAELKQNLKDGETIILGSDLKLDSNLTIDKDVTIVGNGATVSTYPVYIGKDANVTFKDINFTDSIKADVTTGDAVFSNKGITGTVTFDGCTFGNNEYSGIRLGAEEGANIIIRNCTFNFTAYDSYNFIYIQSRLANNSTDKINITIENNTFKGCDNVQKYFISLDYIAKGSSLTCGGNEFYNADGTVSTIQKVELTHPDGSHTYSDAELYSMLTSDAIQTYNF